VREAGRDHLGKNIPKSRQKPTPMWIDPVKTLKDAEDPLSPAVDKPGANCAVNLPSGAWRVPVS
jgi:hypothetical protein